jgi:hypothetical protein
MPTFAREGRFLVDGRREAKGTHRPARAKRRVVKAVLVAMRPN